VDKSLVVYISSWISLGILLSYVIRSHRYAPYNVVRYPPIVEYGVNARCGGSYVKSNDPGIVNLGWFHRNTVILGYDKSGNRGSASAEFCFDLRSKIRKVNEDAVATVTFEAERIHGGLHSAIGPKKKRAIVKANGVALDDFWLIQKMPNGQDYGYRNVGPIPIDGSLLSERRLVITTEIEDETAWDIDRVVLCLESGDRRLSSAGNMVAGAIISVMIGLIPLIIEKLAFWLSQRG